MHIHNSNCTPGQCWHSDSGYDRYTSSAPNPSPDRFKVTKVEQIGKHLIAQINYFDATNYEGNKLCLYKNLTVNDLLQQKRLDPHFSKTGLSPVARFKPDAEGWDLARILANRL